MTVGELIYLLSLEDPNERVICEDQDGGAFDPATVDRISHVDRPDRFYVVIQQQQFLQTIIVE